jgi:hypothetical protein
MWRSAVGVALKIGSLSMRGRLLVVNGGRVGAEGRFAEVNNDVAWEASTSRNATPFGVNGIHNKREFSFRKARGL